MPKNIPVKYKKTDSIPIPVLPAEPIPLGDLEVGESILIARSDRSRAQVLASRLKQKKRGVFTIRVVDTTHCRVWRIE